MKGIVLECDSREAIILTDDGIFSRIKNHNYEIGQAINIKEKKENPVEDSRRRSKFGGSVGDMHNRRFRLFYSYGLCSLDVNPSVEYSINMFDRILDVRAVNDDGEEILSELDLNYMSLEDAVKKTLDQLMKDGYLTDDPNGGVIITTSNGDFAEAEELASKLEQEIQAYIDSKAGIVAEVEAEAVGLERVKEARSLGVTPGKLNLVEKLQSSTSGAIDVEKWLSAPVKLSTRRSKRIKQSKKIKRSTRIKKTKRIKISTRIRKAKRIKISTRIKEIIKLKRMKRKINRKM